MGRNVVAAASVFLLSLLAHAWVFFFFNVTATTEIYTVYNTLSLHDALPIWSRPWQRAGRWLLPMSTARRRRLRTRSEEHTSELQSLYTISYAVFCLKKK